MERIEVRADCVEHRRSGAEYCGEWKREGTKRRRGKGVNGRGGERGKGEGRGEEEVGENASRLALFSTSEVFP